MELRVNGKILDTANAIIAITRNGFDLSDLKKRFMGRTNRFSLPRTHKNTDALEAPNVVASSGRSFENEYNCEVKDQGITIIKGKGILDESGSAYNLQVVEDVKSLFDAMVGTIRSIDMDDSDFVYNNTSYDNLKFANSTLWTWCSDQQYDSDNIAFANVTPSANYALMYLRPHFNVRQIIDRMIEAYGWNIQFPDDKIDSLVMTANHKEFFFTSYVKNMYATSYDGFGIYIQVTGLDYYPVYQNPDITVGNYTINVGEIPTAFRLFGDFEATGNFSLLVTSFYGESESSEEEFDLTGDFVDITTNKLTGIVSFFIKGDVGTSIDFTQCELYSIIEENDFPDWNPPNQPPDVPAPFTGYLVRPYDNMQDIDQLTFFKEILLLLGLGFETNSYINTIECYNYSELSRSNYLDWSEKYINNPDAESVKGMTDNLGRTTFLKYSNDDLVSEKEGRGELIIDNDNLIAESTLVQSDFSASKTLSLTGVLWNSRYFDICDMKIYGQNGRINEAGLRIKRTYDVDSSAFGSVTTFKQLQWGRLSENEYKVLFDALKRGRSVSYYFNLTKLDVVSFKFNQVVYIADKKSYFIVAKIENYQPGRLTKCELIKVN